MPDHAMSVGYFLPWLCFPSKGLAVEIGAWTKLVGCTLIAGVSPAAGGRPPEEVDQKRRSFFSGVVGHLWT